MNQMKVLAIKFDLNQMSFVTMIESFQKDPETLNLPDYRQIIGCDLIDIVNINEEIVIIVDDEGFLKSNNPVIEVQFEKEKLQLAGTLLFTKKHYGPKEVSFVGLSDSEMYNLLTNLKIKVIGVTA